MTTKRFNNLPLMIVVTVSLVYSIIQLVQTTNNNYIVVIVVLVIVLLFSYSTHGTSKHRLSK